MIVEPVFKIFQNIMQSIYKRKLLDKATNKKQPRNEARKSGYVHDAFELTRLKLG